MFACVWLCVCVCVCARACVRVRGCTYLNKIHNVHIPLLSRIIEYTCPHFYADT